MQSAWAEQWVLPTHVIWLGNIANGYQYPIGLLHAASQFGMPVYPHLFNLPINLPIGSSNIARLHLA